MSFLAKLFASIGHFFANLFDKAKPFLEKEIPVILNVVNGIKQGVDMVETGPFKSIIDNLIGKVPAAILEKVNAALPKIITDLGLAKGVVDQTNAEAVLLAALDAIKQAVPTARAAYYTGIAALLVTDITEGKLTYGEAVHIIQKAYDDGINLHILNAAVPEVSKAPDAVENPQQPSENETADQTAN
jgi:hypothetical protein